MLRADLALLNCQQFDPGAYHPVEDMPVFDDEECSILRAQAQENLPPGGGSGAFEIWRCAHCRQIRPYSDGGDSWTGPNCFNDEEREFLGLCCDACWHAITHTVGAVYKRTRERVLQSIKFWP